jgi:biopolymer transport protein ExbD
MGSQSVAGKIVSVDVTGSSLVLQPERGRAVTVKVDANTRITLDSTASTLDKLSAGMWATARLGAVTTISLDAKTPPPPPPPPPLSGKIVKVDASAGTLLVQPQRGNAVLVSTDANTRTYLDGKASSLASLSADMSVVVKFKSGGIASVIEARTPPPPPPPHPIEGKMVSVDLAGGTLVVQPEHRASVKVTTDANTAVVLDGKSSSLASLSAGMSVVVKFRSGGTAARIEARTPPPPPPPHPIEGKIVSVDANAGTLVVQPERGAPVTVTTDANTKVTLDRASSTLASLAAGMPVEVKFRSGGTAALIEARTPPPPPPLVGKIVSVDANAGTLVVQPERGAAATVTTDANTVVTLDHKPSSLASLAPRMCVVVRPPTGTAVTIDAETPLAPPRRR